MEHVNQKWNIEIQLLPSDKATHILERAETAALRGCKNFPQNCFLRSQLGFYSGGSGHCVCSEAVWVTQTSRERTGHTLPQQALQNLRPRLSRSSGLCTSTSCSLQCPALALHPFCLLIIGSLQIIWDRSFSLPLLSSTADINSDIPCLAPCSCWFLTSGSAQGRLLASIHLQCPAKARHLQRGHEGSPLSHCMGDHWVNLQLTERPWSDLQKWLVWFNQDLNSGLQS